MDYGLRADDELIDLTYAALLGEVSWQDFLDRLSDHAPDGRTILFSHNMSQSDEYLAMTSRFAGPELESYASHYVNTNPWLEHCAVRKVGLGIYSDEIIPPGELLKTEFYNDWLAPNDIACSIGVTIDKNGDCPLIISTVTSRADQERNSQFSEQLTRIAPHLRRAARFYRNGPPKWSGFDLGSSLFDAVDVGVIIVGEDGRIKTSSRAGQELLDGTPFASISPLGQLRLRNENAQSVLRAMLMRTYVGQKSVSLVSKGGKLTLIRVEKDRISLYFEGPTVVVLMEKLGIANCAGDIDQFTSIYGLTRAEKRALSGIVNGKSVIQIADEAHLSPETIRTQLKSLYSKTGVNGQAGLLRLVYSQ
ncbi:helix-turn-helix transcriptional regulator [Agrobacterium tumefaciens]|uniref:helix-turn-helix transcriptional regulator n=1 Tax=Agrobacterium tumefaciens TaxID=358 RepID=UPI002243B6BE|nr:helix-turn-helix transcriptional regulator [Agrobacterium tumefaciens]MCW8060446.1 helix-turn-helix transcriptional regulator [Agrobacterium tumefaciens]MCW8145890.1 helix-turn-helix transcriptional regulator [Agrobacterium tumefaciens]